MNRILLKVYRFMLNHWVGSLILACLAGLLFRWLFIETYTMNDESMAPLIIPGDKVITIKYSTLFSKGEQLRQRQIITFRHPQNPDMFSLKRILAVSGDTLEIRKTEISVNQIPVIFIPSSSAPDTSPGWYLWNDLPPLT